MNKTKKRVKILARTMELKNRLLVIVARKMKRDAGDWVSEAQPGPGLRLLGDDGDSEDEGILVAKL